MKRLPTGKADVSRLAATPVLSPRGRRWRNPPAHPRPRLPSPLLGLTFEQLHRAQLERDAVLLGKDVDSAAGLGQ
jgi:hypothetical protein